MTKSPSTEGPVGPGWKLAWIEAVARDLPDAAGSPVAVAVIISSRVDSHGVVKNITHPQVAKRLGMSVRAVARGYAALKARGHIEVLRESRGRGEANEVRIVRKVAGKSMPDQACMTDRSMPDQACMTDRSMPDLVKKHAGFGQEACLNRHTLPSSYPFSYPKRHQKSSIIDAADRLIDKIRSFDALPDQTGNFLDECWDNVLHRLSQPNRLGAAKVQSWLGNEKVRIGSLENGEVTLVASTQFIADRNRTDHSDLILTEWQRIDPTIMRVTFKHGPSPERSVEVAPAAERAAPERPPAKVVPLRERLKAKAATNGD